MIKKFIDFLKKLFKKKEKLTPAIEEKHPKLVSVIPHMPIFL